MPEESVLQRVAMLEGLQKRLVASLLVLLLLLVGAIGTVGWLVCEVARLRSPQSLRVRRLAVVDEHGTERVLIGAPLPDPMILGKRRPRDGQVSGIVIADSTGTERGGYVTSDQGGNALLTLDGQGFQTVLLLAEADGSTTFRIWNQDKASVTMGVLGNPFLNLKRRGEIVFAQPPDNPQSKDPRPFFK